jgi:hypothetical protein
MRGYTSGFANCPMASRPPPRFVVQSIDAGQARRRQLLLAGAWLASLVLVAVVTWLLGNHVVGPVGTGNRAEARKLAADNEDLRQQVANLTRSDQVSKVAADELKHTLAEREDQLNGLRGDLAFYSRLVGGGAQREDLTIQDARLTPIAGAHAWTLTITLTQNAKRGADTRGKATVAVEGLRAGKVVVLNGKDLGDAVQADGIPFDFKYFEQLQATLALPADFRPTRLRIGVDAEGSDPSTRTIAWTDASQPAGDNHVQQ